jgi:hypothetical protein
MPPNISSRIRGWQLQDWGTREVSVESVGMVLAAVDVDVAEPESD